MARTPCAFPLLLLLLLGPPLKGPAPALGYNIDTVHPEVLASNASRNFGYQVLQFKDASIIVGAPGDQNSTGELYQCAVKKGSCQPIPLPASAQTAHLGMSLASSGADAQMIACGSGLSRTCDGNQYLSGICYLFKGHLEQPKEMTPGFEVDVDGDGDTDVLLVGAPLYYEDRSGGRVHIYRWDQARLTNTAVLQGALGNPLGRFGAAITALADLNGDGWADVAVGAPLESAERGAVYIYNGHQRELNTHYSQVPVMSRLPAWH
nr:integrin alpha-L-like [Chrysemys picta bellii]